MISLPPKGDTAKKLGAYFTPLRVSAQAVPNMSVFVSEGSFWTANNEHMEYFGGTSPTVSAPASDAKWVLITVTSTGLLNVVDGIASGTPVLPPASSYTNELPLAALFIGDTTTAITDAMIFDARPLWSIPPDSVSQAQLNNFATITYVDNGLNLKADVTGTANADFTLNVGGSSINDSGIYIDRFSGPNVGIRFNETVMVGSPPVSTALWEFTNNGTDYFPLGASTGTFYSIAALDAGALDSLYYQENEFGGIPGAGVLDSRYFEQSVATSMFAPTMHTHSAAVITDLDAALNTYITGTMMLNDVSNVSVGAPVLNDLIQFDGTSWSNISIVNAVGNEYVRRSGSVAETITGIKSFADTTAFQQNVTIAGDLTVVGTNTSLDVTNLVVTDQNVTLNAGYVGATSGSTGSGIHIDRNGIIDPQAVIVWDDAIAGGRWTAGLDGTEEVVALENVTAAQPLYERVEPLAVVAVYSLTFGVPAPAVGSAGIQVFVNGIKQVEGATKAFTVDFSNPAQVVVTFNAGSEPAIADDVEFYGFGTIG